MKAEVLIATCLMVFSLLLGCSEKPTDNFDETALTVDTYFPLNPRTMIYKVIQSDMDSNIELKETRTFQDPRIIDDIEVTPLVFDLAPSHHIVTYFYQNISDSVFLVAIQVGDKPSINRSEKQLVFKSPIKKGRLLESIFPKYIEYTNETIKVPYGEFGNCIRVKTDLPRSSESTAWYAPNIGLIKYIDKSNMKGSVFEKQGLLKDVR